MSNMRVLSIFGTRPEAVKMAPVIQQLNQTPGIESKVCVTAQHREMLDQILALFNIQPDVDLNLMHPNQSLSELTTNILTHLDPILVRYKPDWVLVQGDTTTVMAAGILCYYHHIRVGHVEAGLRTNDKWQPFPEEINRRIAGVVADLHFAPTQHNRQNLLREGVPDWRVAVTGNPVIDALESISQLPPPASVRALLQKWNIRPGGKQLILITAHRRENFGKPLEDICAALKKIAESFAERLLLIDPVHLNPNVQKPVYHLLGGIDNILLLPPQDYLSMVHLMKHSTLIITDSGGIQEEATAMNIPTLVLREVTERPEGVEAGILKLVGSDPQRIVNETLHLLEDQEAYQAMASAQNPFGDGHAAQHIVQALLAFEDPGQAL
jgi:UDP-N-acetylglucosamine 2-epimerase (non-hydrolysing)